VTDHDFEDNEYEVVDADGKIHIMQGEVLTKEQYEKEEERILEAAEKDPMFTNHTKRRILRFSRIVERVEGDLEDGEDDEAPIDFTDDARDHAKASNRWILCKRGAHVTEMGPKGRNRRRRLTDHEIDQDDLEERTCELCTSRNKYAEFFKTALKKPRMPRSDKNKAQKRRERKRKERKRMAEGRVNMDGYGHSMQ
jgi:hypothetical protein